MDFPDGGLPAKLVVGVADVKGGLDGVGALVEVDQYGFVHSFGGSVGA